MSSKVTELTNSLSPAEREELLRQLQAGKPADPAPDTAPPRRKRTPLDMSEATPVTFVADLVAGDRAKDSPYLGERALWATGMSGARGPQGGVYFYGRAVIAVGKDRRRAQIKVGKKHFDVLAAGGAMPVWVRFDGETTDTLIGVATGYREVEAPAAATV